MKFPDPNQAELDSALQALKTLEENSDAALQKYPALRIEARDQAATIRTTLYEFFRRIER